MQPQTTANADLDRPVWGAKNFAPIVNRTPSQVFYLLKRQKLDATKVDDLYVSTPRRLLSLARHLDIRAAMRWTAVARRLPASKRGRI